MAIRYTVPEPPIEDFKGWGDDDLFDMHEQADVLTRLFKDLEESLVVGFNAEWGTGKTVFLRRWKHLNDETQTGIKIVYFDAFENDCLDDPFTALTAEILKEVVLSEKLKKIASAFIKNTVKVGANYLTSNLAGGATDKFFENYKNRKDEIKAFKDELEEIAKKEGRLVIIVDELDRCRPDFALVILEQIKHLFDVPHVHFILGYKEDSLMNIIKTRYGADIDAKKYLDKFITVNMKHELKIKSIDGSNSLYGYFREKCREMELTEDIHKVFEKYYEEIIQTIFKKYNPPLRDVNQLLTKLALTPFPNISAFSLGFVVFLIFMRALKPDLYEKLKQVENYENDLNKAHVMCSEALLSLDLLEKKPVSERVKEIIIYHLDYDRYCQEFRDELESGIMIVNQDLREMFAHIERVQIPSVDEN